MKIAYDFIYLLTGITAWTWIVIGLIGLAMLLIFTFWASCVLAKRADEQSERLFQKMMENKEVYEKT